MKKTRNILIDIITSKSFIGSFVFAIALWVYTSLNAEYTTFIKVPLTIILPTGRSIASEIPPVVQVELKGTGWHLLNLFFINTNISCKVNLTNENELDTFKITRKELTKGLSNIQSLNTIDFSPELITFSSGKVDQNAVPIKSNIKINPYEGYMVVGDIIMHPNMVVLKGSSNTIKNFEYWETKKISIDGLTDTYETTVDLSDSLNNIIFLSENQISAQINVQQIAEQTVYDVPVKIKGGSLTPKHKLEPEFLTVIIRGGINQLYDFSPESISAEVNLTDILNDSTGIIIPEIKVPKNIKAINVYPNYLKHKIIENISKK